MGCFGCGGNIARRGSLLPVAAVGPAGQETLKVQDSYVVLPEVLSVLPYAWRCELLTPSARTLVVLHCIVSRVVDCPRIFPRV